DPRPRGKMGRYQYPSRAAGVSNVTRSSTRPNTWATCSLGIISMGSPYASPAYRPAKPQKTFFSSWVSILISPPHKIVGKKYVAGPLTLPETGYSGAAPGCQCAGQTVSID